MHESGETLVAATYNIHRGVGRDRRTDHQRIARVILDLDADIIALQEVETPAARAPGAVVLLHHLCQHGYEPVLGSTMYSAHGSYGNVLLSRLAVTERRRHDLSRRGREPRGLIEATLATLAPGRTPYTRKRTREIKCFATHLGLSIRERRWQIRRLSERIDQSAKRTRRSDPMILLGDFNEWWARRLAPITAQLMPVPPRATYPGGWPLVALDRIWYHGMKLDTLEVVRTGATRVASDHLPLRAVFKLNAKADVL